MTKDPRIDAYIANSADFAKPVLTRIRTVVHAACPDVEETIKWGFPHFDYHGIMCATAAFKAHVTLGFWKGALILPAAKRTAADEAMGSFGRITSVADLPSDKLLAGYIKKAMALNETGVKAPHMANRKTKPPLKVPPYVTAAVRKNKKALATWDAFSPSHRREYVEWVTGAKTDETRDRRLATMMTLLAEGKSYNWKYERKK